MHQLLAGRLKTEEMPEKFCQVLNEHLGGTETVEMVNAFHNRSQTQEQLAQRFGVNKSTVSRRIREADEKLKRLGLFPPRWQSPPADEEIEP